MQAGSATDRQPRAAQASAAAQCQRGGASFGADDPGWCILPSQACSNDLRTARRPSVRAVPTAAALSSSWSLLAWG